MEVALALAAALLFSLGTVLQEQVAAEASEAEARSAGFLLRLARRPRWLVGIVADGLGFVAQAAALAIGRLVVVQPILATAVVFALPIGAALGGRRVSRHDLIAAIAVTAGLGAFLVIADPSGGIDDPSASIWFISFGVCGAIAGVLALVARGRSPTHRAALIGTAAGVLFALSAALTKATVEELDEGVLAVLKDWHLYALIVVGYVSMTLSQASLQSGALAPAVATQMSLDPITSVFLGTLAFDETIHENAGTLIVALGAFAVMIVGLVYLALHEEEEGEDAVAEEGAPA